MTDGKEHSGRLALVTGANRGIGLETARQLAQLGFTVLMGVRDLAKGQEAGMTIGGKVEAIALDVAVYDAAAHAAAEVERRFGRLDVLVNNAAIHYDPSARALRPDWTVIREAFEINVFGAWRVAAAFAPLLTASGHGRLVNVSSEGGSLASMGAGAPAYSTSKATLNALTRILAAELRGSGVLVNSICPGWVATDMGGPGGRPVAQGAAGIVWAATLPDDGPTGGFFRDGKRLPW
ncbi:SDR family NAD(P)-dependent oxidoreductase [Mesorhizobium sp.]|jgi:NAD(P)-dependent dehydrogenase (short-subunit alcohol dehydrogenase family)|uniref:SDR family NAD(P)-dependent oxidoreductase n=1 Tax=Mesorhizobium sp. TaxID=1871066 RepID=UPI000FE40BB6|nr:SDR family NAD(P)-dependent oxidoreductase [Mesorhizobium sp.]RWH68080.1 MAG: SDR family NAD(P)-dependent oxidoreductase [Mesorhizobium sp.]RWL20181.1 MAG: SDR family NAD(P)-dependent oxidoreductase [Mesorhizobium sp.]RWL27122.1 MAG: SDR family NAD(P)-dependent oxidoreductase [Mesorhizobium sp.]RWL27689.1 MAG: SDR family NAD(P)-dependent oxidoreductase [Mesorhizobium sp.]RWL46368.1 MAG: SDR family NAD(P)-dependent oxidoreductase [Mesorhizobium sp.]